MKNLKLTTNEGTNYSAAIVIAMTAAEVVPEQYRAYYLVFWGLVLSFVLYITKGHEALPPNMEEPKNDE